MGPSKDYFNHKAKLPMLKKLTLAYMLTCKGQDNKLTKLDDKTMLGFALPILLPDTTIIIKAIGACMHIFDAEDAFNEALEKWTNLSTTFTPITSMSSTEDVIFTRQT